MKVKYLGQPCKNFNILGIITILDPKDGKEKVVLSNFASGETGNLIFVDPAGGEGESIPLPGDAGAWAVLNLDNERLLVGTCPGFGYLHSLDLKTRQWAKPLRDEHETYIWNLCRGSDGMVYGGTWPGCVLLRYDPRRNVLENMGRMSEDKDNQYSRTVYGGLPGHILIACGVAQPHLTLWDIQSHTTRRFGKPDAQVREITERVLCLATGGKLEFYDVNTLEPIEKDLSNQLTPAWQPPYPGTGLRVKLNDGRMFAVRGQEYYIAGVGEARPALKAIPTTAPATHIMTITSDPQGRIWGSCGFGQTIFSYDPAAGKDWNSPVVCNAGGEVYGLACAEGKLFMAAYSGGDHVVYDPAKSWDQINNTNPRTLRPAGPSLVRPSAKSVIGPDGNFWTGWMACYGVYGGGLSRVDVKTLEVTLWQDPIPQQPIVSLTADETYLYFTTGGGANGLPEKVEPFYFVVWSQEGKIVWQHRFESGARPGLALAVGGRVLVQLDKTLRVFNPRTTAFESSIELDSGLSCMRALKDGAAAVFCGNKLWRINPVSGEKTFLGDLPQWSGTATVTPDGELYFACGSRLYRMEK